MKNVTASSVSEPLNHALQICCAASLILFFFLASAVLSYGRPYFSWDLVTSHDLQALARPDLTAFMELVSLPGDHVRWSGLLLFLACAVLLACRAWRPAAVLVLAVAVGQLVKIAVKELVARPRPSSDLVQVLTEAKEIHSFPSGHTVHYVVFFGFLWFLALTLLERPVLRWPALALLGAPLLLVGPARVYLGAHWVSDVLGGYLLGVGLLMAHVGLYRRWSDHSPITPSQGKLP